MQRSLLLLIGLGQLPPLDRTMHCVKPAISPDICNSNYNLLLLEYIIPSLFVQRICFADVQDGEIRSH